MEIRKDFDSVGTYMHRLASIAEAFKECNLKTWPYLKNNEDFKLIYTVPLEKRLPIEEIYGIGRDCAVAMSFKLQEFNYFDEYPTLSSYIDSFENGWVYRIEELNGMLVEAKRCAESLGHNLWAVDQMFQLFAKQLNLLGAIKDTLGIIKKSHLYKVEKGDSPMEKDNNSGASVNTINIGVAHNSPIAQGINSSQQQSVSYALPTPEQLRYLTDAISKNIGDLGLVPADEKKVKAQVATIEAQLIDEPNPTIVREACSVIKNITLGAIGSLLASAAQPGLWSGVKQVLDMF